MLKFECKVITQTLHNLKNFEKLNQRRKGKKEKMEKKKKQNLFAKSKNEAQGITLIALVITIIVLLILAAVSIATLTGDNGILTKAQTASEKTKEASVKEEIQTEIMAAFDNRGSFDAKTFKTKMQEAGATVTEEDGNIVVEKDGYEATIDAKTGEIKNFESSKGVKPQIKATVEKTEDNKATIKVEVTNEVEKVDSIIITNLDTGYTPIEVTVNGKTGSVQVEKNGTYKVEVKATTEGVQKAGETTIVVNVIPVVEFTKSQGKIDVIWVNTNNEKIDKPLVPETLPSGMMKVYWNGTNEIREYQEAGVKNQNFQNENWYNYVAGDNKKDSKDSKWANAINTVDGVESYFVWIPRYAYRITYLTAEGKIAGYCDGDGIRDISGNKQPDPQNVKENKEIETVEYNGFKYIVHPAFEGNVNNGGWDSDLEGIWVGKYESAKDTATAENSSSYGGDGTKIKIVPNVTSWRDITIGNCYTNAFDYDRDKESHLMKNSEWGAVSYLTYSQYGRNGHEITMNKSSNYSFITESGTEGEDINLVSSTGNKFGVFDLSGGATEYVAAFNDQDTSENLSNGNSFTTDKKNTKYATKYSSTSSMQSYDSYIPGDATYEVYKGTSKKNWLNDYGSFVYPSNPFFRRGGNFNDGEGAGVFSVDDDDGNSYNTTSFRVVLPGV